MEKHHDENKGSLFVGALALACLVSAHAQELDGEAKKKLAIAGAAVGKAIDVHDIAALEKLWSPKLLVNSPNNHVLTRADVFDAIRAGKLNYEGGYKFALEKIEFYDNIAVAMGEDTYIP